MFAPFICQNISPCPPLILHTTSVAPHLIVTNQSFVNVVEIKTEMGSVVTSVCLALRFVTSANKGELTYSLLFALKPVVCKQCNTRFTDNVLLSSHLKFCNVAGLTSSKIKPVTMTVPASKEPLRLRGLSVAGNKDVLVKRLEGAIAGKG